MPLALSNATSASIFCIRKVHPLLEVGVMTLVSHDESPPSYDVAMSNGYVQAFTASRGS